MYPALRPVAIWHVLNDGSICTDTGGHYYTRRTPDKARSRAVD